MCLHHPSTLLHVLTASMVVAQEALANKQACHPNQPLRAPMPSHWTDMPQDANVEYVELPLPPGCSPAYDLPADQHALPPLNEEVLKAMMYQVWILSPFFYYCCRVSSWKNLFPLSACCLFAQCTYWAAARHSSTALH